MTPNIANSKSQSSSSINRRQALVSTLAATAGLAAGPGNAPAAAADLAQPSAVDSRKGSPKPYRMKKSINLWAFPYPSRMSLRECLELAKACRI